MRDSSRGKAASPALEGRASTRVQWHRFAALLEPLACWAGASGRRCEYRDTWEVSVMTTAIIGTGGIGSAIARLLGSGGETLRLSSADPESARRLAAQIGPTAVVATTTATRCRAPTPSSSRCASPC